MDRIDILLAHDLNIFTHGTKGASDQRIKEFMAGGYKALVRLRDEKVIGGIGAGINEWQVAKPWPAPAISTPSCSWPLHAAGAGGAGELPALLRREEHRDLSWRALQLRHSRHGPKPGAFYNYNEAPPEIMARVGKIKKVCESHGVKLIEAALRFPLGHKQVVSVIPGAQSASEVKRNAKSWGPRFRGVVE